MKVLFVDVNYKNSSTGKIVYDLSEQLKQNGHQAKVLFGRGADLNNESVYRVASVPEVYFHALMTRVTGLVGMYSHFSTDKLIQEIKSFKPDVVHLHELHGYYINIKQVIEYLKLSNIAVVWTFHCEFMYTGKCGYAYECDQWMTECIKCPQLKEYPASLYFDFTNFMFNQKKEYMQDFINLNIVTPSKWLSDRVKLSFLKDKNLSVIHNGIDTSDIFYPREVSHLIEKHSLKDKKVILAVAPDIMDERKGGDWILRLAERFDDSYRFIMIGLEEELKNPPKNIIAIGKTEDQVELAEYYSIADFLLLTSLKETFSLVTAESLACGTPVIGFDSGAPVEVAPSGYGYFVPYGNLDSLESGVNKFYDKSLTFKSSIECRDFAVYNYSKEQMFASYLNLYQKINDKG